MCSTYLEQNYYAIKGKALIHNKKRKPSIQRKTLFAIVFWKKLQ